MSAPTTVHYAWRRVVPGDASGEPARYAIPCFDDFIGLTGNPGEIYDKVFDTPEEARNALATDIDEGRFELWRDRHPIRDGWVLVKITSEPA